MYKESQINSGKGHRTGAASFPGVRGRAQIRPPPPLRDVRIRSRVYSVVPVGICLVMASCPI